ncbi:heavy metal-associated isoprenylated plant protein 7-like [Durio zibethinus]|uniref:Heavy metal-associated isoprenylated plant protein 7-like n=1 Tax=Durio zibethinus TaxID=66656 RepID=A0A6P5XQ70_DURZI|nr:heavy metal-associated isoprenylated plant protein 7-like [Durio zibethinus]
MGEEEKKPAEEKKMEEGKAEDGKKGEEEEAKQVEKPAEEKKTEESKDGKEAKEESPAPPQEIILKVYMHCEGCARKVRRCLKGFEGVEDVMTDCKSNKVVVKGEKADPLKVLERVQRKSHRQVELVSPIPKPPAPEEEKKAEEKEKPKPEEKKEEPQVISVVLKVHMHCEACAQEIKKRIQRMKGVESAEPDLKSSEVTVKGVFDPPKLVEYVYKRTGKHAAIVKKEPESKKEEEKAQDANKEEKKGEEGGDKEKKEASGEDNEDKKEGGDSTEANVVAAAAAATTGGAAPADATEETKVVELKINEYSHYAQRYATEFYHAYPPQIFSDENPNACSVM